MPLKVKSVMGICTTAAGETRHYVVKEQPVGNVALLAPTGTAKPSRLVDRSRNGRMVRLVLWGLPAMLVKTQPRIGGAKPLLPVEASPDGPTELVASRGRPVAPVKTLPPGGIANLGIIAVSNPANIVALFVEPEPPVMTAVREALIALGINLEFVTATNIEGALLGTRVHACVNPFVEDNR